VECVVEYILNADVYILNGKFIQKTELICGGEFSYLHFDRILAKSGKYLCHLTITVHCVHISVNSVNSQRVRKREIHKNGENISDIKNKWHNM